MLILLLLQASSLEVAPDIAFVATVRAREVTIERRGEARLEVHAQPDAGSVVDIKAPSAEGRKRLRNVRISVAAEARIADPQAAAAGIADAAEPPQLN